MQVSSINSYGIYNNHKNTNFKASLSPKLNEALMEEAQKIGPDAVTKLGAKISEVAKWGSATSELQKVQNELSKKASSIALNIKYYPAYFDTKLKMSQRLPLLEQFYAMKPEHVETAEKDLFLKYNEVDTEATSKVVNNPELIELLTGSPKFDANEIAYRMEQFTPQETLDFAKQPISYLVEKYGK